VVNDIPVRGQRQWRRRVVSGRWHNALGLVLSIELEATVQAFDRAWRDAAAYDPTGAGPTGTARVGARSAGANLVGYQVEATDGGIGLVDEASYETGASYLIVDTDPRINGQKVLLPAGTVQRVDHNSRTVYLLCTEDQVKHSPEYDRESLGKPSYRDRVGSYFEDRYRSARP
jgi:hypothetical protein